MFFSKSFGYALRGVLYVALMNDENRKIRIDEMANRLSVPRHFLGKIMNKVAKKGILDSTKGPKGGFSLNSATLQTPLISLIETMDGVEQFDSCLMRLKKCNENNPCPLHNLLHAERVGLRKIFSETKVGDLLKEDKPDFIRSISAV
jgi:Rrf2 family protein